MDRNIGYIFQVETSYSGGKIAPPSLVENPKIIELPKPKERDFSLFLSIKRRRSKRDFIKKSIDIYMLSLILWYIQGVSAPLSKFRVTPSAGALYPLDTYLYANGVDGLEKGIYLYVPDSHGLLPRSLGEFSFEIEKATLFQNMAKNAAVTFIWVGVLERSFWRYRERAYRYIYLDAGHICQNLYLVCEAMDLGCCAIGAFYDDVASALLNLSKFEHPVYMACAGWVR